MASLEYRVTGEWETEVEMGADEWSIAFLSDGRYLDIYRPDDDRESGVWSFDEATGIISIVYDGGRGCNASKHILDKTGEGVFLYSFNDEPHIRLDRATIIAHHAHMRQRLARPYPEKPE